MITFILLILLYFAGYYLCRKMLLIEHLSEKEELTKGDEVLINAMSILSWFMILFMLVISWVRKIAATGYWKKPLNPKAE